MRSLDGERAYEIHTVVSAGAHSPDRERAHRIASAVGNHVGESVRSRGKPFFREIRRLYREISNVSADFIFLEGTGIQAGIATIAASMRTGTPYLISSGDAVGPYMRNRHGSIAGVVFIKYERLLYRKAHAFIGWSPHFTGRAISLGARRAVTIEGFTPRLSRTARSAGEVRADLGFDDTDIVVGVVGSINWSERQKYAYGLELVNAAKFVENRRIKFLVVGDGNGLERLKRLSRNLPITFVGRVERAAVASYMSAMDVAVISQTADEVGMLRLTTKLPEFLQNGVPLIVNATAPFLDYLATPTSPALFLPPDHPASERHARALAKLLDSLDRRRLRELSPHALAAAAAFDLRDIAPRLMSLLTNTLYEDAA